MTAGTFNEMLTPDDLRTTCPACNGTGLEPQSPSNQHHGGVGQRVVPMYPAKCGHRLCQHGKVPTVAGLALLKFIQDYRDVTV